jgi:hypothetical protein
MKVFLSLCKSFEEKNQNKVKKLQRGCQRGGMGQAEEAIPPACGSRKQGSG